MHADHVPSGMRGKLNLRALLIDLNGTLHVGSTPTPRAVEALRKLRQSRMPLLFCSNSTKESTKSLLEGLRRMEFEVEEKEVMTSLGACRALVEERKLSPLLLLSPSAHEEFAHIVIPEGDYDSVILGLHSPSLSYEPLNKAFRVLKGEPVSFDSDAKLKPAAALIAPHASLFQQSEKTADLPAGLSLGIGPFVKALEVSSGIEAELVGKPTKRFFELAIKKMQEAQEWDGEGDVGMVGDDVNNDLGAGARELGLKRILVRTGKYRPGAEDGHDLDAVYDTFADLVDDLERL